MADDDLKMHYRTAEAVQNAVARAIDDGLSAAEERVITRRLERGAAIIDAGCGAGRVALGMWELGYRGLVGVDFSREMVAAARELGRKLEYEVPFRVGDLRRLKLADGVFDGVVTDAATWAEWAAQGETGLVARELARVVRSGGTWLVGGGEGSGAAEERAAADWSWIHVGEGPGAEFWLASRK